MQQQSDRLQCRQTQLPADSEEQFHLGAKHCPSVAMSDVSSASDKQLFLSETN